MIVSISRCSSSVPYKVRWLMRAMRANHYAFDVYMIDDIALPHAYWVVLSFSCIDGVLLSVSSALSVPIFPFKFFESDDDLFDYLYKLCLKLPKSLYQ